MLEKSFNMSKWIINDSVSTKCYDPELCSGCNLGKNWSKRNFIQLVSPQSVDQSSQTKLH